MNKKVTQFHKDSLTKRFPKAMELYDQESGTGTWKDIADWITKKLPDTRHYVVGLQKIENSLK